MCRSRCLHAGLLKQKLISLADKKINVSGWQVGKYVCYIQNLLSPGMSPCLLLGIRRIPLCRQLNRRTSPPDYKPRYQ